MEIRVPVFAGRRILKKEIEQNRCAMACQGCGAVFLLFLKKAVDYFLKSIYC